MTSTLKKDLRKFQISYQDKVWTTTELLARGGFSKIFRVSSGEASRPLACKLVERKPSESLYQFQKFYKVEKLCAFQLRHPGIVQVFDCRMDRHQRFYYILMELCSQDLFEYAVERRDRRLNQSEARCYFKQIVDAMAFIHSKQVAHRDVKLENVLVKEAFLSPSHPHKRVVINDFGLSRIKRTTGNARIGTRYSMAPEVLSQTGPYDLYKTDVWGLGVILYVLLNRRFPFDTSDSKVQQSQQKNGRWLAHCRHLPTSIRDSLSSLLRVDPQKRPSVNLLKETEWLR